MNSNSEAFFSALENVLLRDGSINATSFERARVAQARTGDRIDRILVQLGLVSEEKVVAALGQCLGFPSLVLSEIPRSPLNTSEIPITFLRNNKVIPIAVHPDRTDVAVVDPFNQRALNALSYFLETTMSPHLISESDFERAFAALYGADAATDIPASAQFLDDALGAEDETRLRDLANEAPVIQLVQQLITSAVEQGASDIHVEPLMDSLRVRFRLDGALAIATMLPASMRAPVASRLKVMAQLNIAERRLPQDGRLKIAVRGRDIDFRVSTTPTLYGESIVLRVLDRSRVALTLDALGFSDEQQSLMRRLLQQPNGILLVTGPTGSGKTTTLYAALRLLNETSRKIHTVEDPIEYQLAGVNQVQVNTRIGLDFATALRSILRQDPDILMIGEIRDAETAHIAVQAALTGHLVLSTVHTNSAASTVTRLLNMGVEGYLLASTLIGVSAQRLVGRLCPTCAVVSDEVEQRFRALCSHIEPSGSIKSARGCSDCRGTGYRGRTTVTELMPVSEDIRAMITRAAPEKSIEERAIQEGMQTLLQHGLERVAAGETSLDEVLRVSYVD